MKHRCRCGEQTHGNGQRLSKATDWVSGTFLEIPVVSRRFRCPSCSAPASTDEPILEPGFRMTVEAADELGRIAGRDGIAAAAASARLDKGTVSRLVKARYERYLAATVRPSIVCVSCMQSGGFRVSDGKSGRLVASFARANESRMVSWLSDPVPAVVIPDYSCISNTLHWDKGFTIGLSVGASRNLFTRPLYRAANRLLEVFDIGREERRDATCLLLDELSNSSEVSSNLRTKLFCPGAPGRHFIRVRQNLDNIQFASSCVEGNRRIDAWISGLDGIWADVFAPVSEVISVFRHHMFSHPACIDGRFADDDEERNPAIPTLVAPR